MPVKRMVVGLDFSEGSDVAMKAAFTLALAFDAAIDLVHVVQAGVLIGPHGTTTLVDGEALAERIDEALASFARKASASGLVCQTSTLEGFPSRELVRHAERTNADMIVVGTHGRTGIQHVVLGSVAERVVQHASCAVLVIPQRRREAN